VEIDATTATGLPAVAAPKRNGSTHFKPGRSGNSKGRPTGSQNRKKIIARVMGEMHVMREYGKRRRCSTLELILMSLRNRAAEGEVRAFQALHDWLERFEPRPPTQPVGYLVVPEQPLDKEKFLQQLAEHQRALMEDVNWLDRLGGTAGSNPS